MVQNRSPLRAARRALFAALLPVIGATTTAGLGAGPAFANESPATLRLDLEQSVIAPSTEPVDVHVLIRLDGRPAPVFDAEAERQLLNLGLTLDTSGSMADARKWEYALDATNRVIDRLTGADRLSITTYSYQASALAAQDDLSRPEALRAKLAGIYPEGGTNISAGLKNSARLVAFSKDEDRLTRVVLMSDGLANEGITEQDEMRRLVKRMAKSGITVSTIGLGSDYDEAMLRAIAEAGNGNYYYVESPAQTTTIFDQEVRGLLQTVAEDVRLNLVGGEGIEAELLNDIEFAEQSHALGTLRHDETIILVARFTLPRARVGEDIDLGSVQITLKERETGRMILLEEPLRLSVSADAETVATSLKGDVSAERTLVEIERAEREAAALAAEGAFEAANTLYSLSQTKLSQAADSLSGKLSAAQMNNLKAKQQALELLSERMTAPSPASAGSIKAANQSLFYANKGQRKLSVMQPGDKGFEIENLQRALKDAGYAISAVNGDFDDEVEAAVRAFQAASGLTVDGLAGPATLAKLGLY